MYCHNIKFWDDLGESCQTKNRIATSNNRLCLLWRPVMQVVQVVLCDNIMLLVDVIQPHNIAGECSSRIEKPFLIATLYFTFYTPACICIYYYINLHQKQACTHASLDRISGRK